MSFKRHLRLTLTVLITCMLTFLATFDAIAIDEFQTNSYWIEPAWVYGWDDAIPFTELGFYDDWGWSNGSFGEGTYTLDLYAAAYDYDLENGSIAGEVLIEYNNGYVEVSCEMFEDFYQLNEAYLWIGPTPIPPNASGEFWYDFTHELDASYAFSGNIYVALYAVVTTDPIVTSYGAEAANSTGNPIGGGNGYTHIISRNDPDIDFIVDTKSELLSAFQNAEWGDIIYVEGYASINMGTTTRTVIPAGVTLASDRGVNGALGGRIYTTRNGIRLFNIGGEGVRITGLRLEGPHKTIKEQSTSNKTVGMYCPYQYLEVDNCELFGWSDAAIGISGTGGDDMITGGYIHHNNIHHNQASGNGYGVVLSSGGVALIEANYFDYCRHAISGTGVAGDGFEARFNICGPNWISTSAHNFDMHGATVGTQTIAGTTIKIYNNTFMGTTAQMPTCIAIRGIPLDGAYITNNWFYFTRSEPVWQQIVFGNMHVFNNLIGEEPELSVKGPVKIY